MLWIRDSIATVATPAQRLVATPAQRLVALYYGREAEYVYYDGCSTDGAQGFALAQFHPHLFVGIYAGSPGNWYSHLLLSFLWNGVHTQNASFLSQDTLDLITKAAKDECDANDGVSDGIIENPLACNFSISSLQCSSNSTTNSSAYLTAAQVAAVSAIYAGPTDSRNESKQIYPDFDVGSENTWYVQETELYTSYSVPILQNLVFEDPGWDYTTFNFGSDVDKLDSVASPLIDALSPDLSAYRNRGGKMPVTQGWTDPYNAGTWPIEHPRQIQSFVGGDVSDFFNLFMIPGGGHCGATEQNPQVPATYHVLDALMPWVESGSKPKSMLSSDPPDLSNRTRKLCAWPQAAVYQGGDSEDWTSFECEA